MWFLNRTGKSFFSITKIESMDFFLKKKFLVGPYKTKTKNKLATMKVTEMIRYYKWQNLYYLITKPGNDVLMLGRLVPLGISLRN